MPHTYSTIDFNSTNVRKIRLRQKVTTLFLRLMWWLVPGTTRKFMSRQFFSPVRYPLSSTQQQILDRARRFRIPINGKTMECWKWGSGPSMLLVHGWNGRGVHLHPYLGSLLGAGYSVIAFDAPAHGESGGQTTNYFEFADAVKAILDSDQGRDIQGIVAHSIGGAAAIAAVAKTGISLEMVLIAPALKAKELLYNTFNHFGIPSSIYLDIIARLQQRHSYDLDHDNPYDLAEQITSEFLIIHDRNDTLIPYMDARKLAATQPHVLLHTTTGLGHKRVIADPAVMDVALGFLMRSRPDAQRPQQEASIR